MLEEALLVKEDEEIKLETLEFSIDELLESLMDSEVLVFEELCKPHAVNNPIVIPNKTKFFALTFPIGKLFYHTKKYKYIFIKKEN